MFEYLTPRLWTRDVDEYAAKRYSREQKLVHAREARIVRSLVLDIAPVGAGLRVLDLPCGYGRMLPILGPWIGSIVNSDRAPDMVEAAEARAAELEIDSEACVCDFQELPHDDNEFDLAISFRFVHHLDFPEERLALFAQIARVTRRHAIISFYDRSWLHRAQRSAREALKGNKVSRPGSMLFLGERRFRQECEQSGLRVVHTRRALPALHAHTIALVEVAR